MLEVDRYTCPFKSSSHPTPDNCTALGGKLSIASSQNCEISPLRTCSYLIVGKSQAISLSIEGIFYEKLIYRKS